MRVLTMLAVTLLVGSGPVRAQESAQADSNAQAEIEALEHHLIALLERRDLDSYASYLAEDYVRVNARGVVSTKDEALAGFASTDPVQATPSDIHVRVYGDMAILTFVLTTERDEKTARSRLVKVFVRRDGRWIMVHNQGTALE